MEAIDFKILSMMELRSSPGDILDRVRKNGEAFIIERSGQQMACLVPVSHFFPDILKSKYVEGLDALRLKGETFSLNFSEKKELEIFFKNPMGDEEVTIKIVLPHGYPSVAPKVYVSPILINAPHRWQDGALCIFGAMTTWNPGKHGIDSILELSRKWLSHYDIWKNTGTWPNRKEDEI
jgi:hypothetical protein